MIILKHYEIILKRYHNETVARVAYTCNGEFHESQLYSISEINNIIRLWQMGELSGSFGINTILTKDASFQIIDAGNIV